MSIERVKVCLDNSSMNSYFQPNGNYIYVSGSSKHDMVPGIILHEFGHYLMNSSSKIPNNSGGPHSIYDKTNPYQAYSEGWASFFAESVMASSSWYGGGFTINAESPVPDEPSENNEVAANAVMWDLSDSQNEVYGILNFKMYINPRLPAINIPIDIADKINGGFDSVKTAMIGNNNSNATMRTFWNSWNVSNSSFGQPFYVWQNFARHGMAKVDQEKPIISSINIVNPTVKTKSVVETIVSDNVKVAGVVFYVNGNYFSHDLEAPYLCTIDPINFKTGKYSLKVVAYDFAGLTSSDSRNAVWKDKSFVPQGGSGTASAPSEGILDMEDTVEFDFRMPFDSELLSFTIEDGMGTEAIVDSSLQNVEQSIQQKGYKKTTTTISNVVSGSSSELFNFEVKSGIDYLLMLDSPDSSFNVELIKPDGTIFKQVENPSPPFGVELKGMDPGIWKYRISPLEIADTSSNIAHGIGERPGYVTLNDFNGYTKVSNPIIHGTAAGADVVKLSVEAPDQTLTSYQAQVINGMFTFDNIQLTNGSNKLKFQAIDPQGLEGDVLVENLVYDDEAPQLNVKAVYNTTKIPLDDSGENIIYDDSVIFEGTVSETSSITINGEEIQSDEKDGIMTFNIKKMLSTGLNVFDVEATDLSGNSITQNIVLNRIGQWSFEENEPKIVDIDDIGDYKYQINVSDESLFYLEADFNGISINNVDNTFTLDVSNLADGSYPMYLVATDLWGNKTVKKMMVDVGQGNGLKAEYYKNIDFTEMEVSRIDPDIDFDWRSASDPIDEDGKFSVRWSGTLKPVSTENYVFSSSVDTSNLFKLWIDENLILDYQNGICSGSMQLQSGKSYSIKVVYATDNIKEEVKLLWDSFSRRKEVIPKACLYDKNVLPTATPTTMSTPTSTSMATATLVATATSTTATVTPTPTTTLVTNTPVVSAGIKLEYCNGNTSENTNNMNLKIRITNTGNNTINLSDIVQRYYYTIDGEKAQSFYCDWATVGSANITSKFVKMTNATSAADYYLEVGFVTAAGSLASGASTEITARIAKQDWSNYTLTNDYSYVAATSYREWNKITAYIKGVLSWGVSPDSTIPSPTATATATPTATSTATATPTPMATATARPTATTTPTATATATPTATAIVTATAAATPSATATATAAGSVTVKMFNGSTAASVNGINPKFNITNSGANTINLSDLKIRYYYTIDGDKVQNFWCDWSSVGSANLTSSFIKMTTPKTGADYYLEIGFKSGAGTIAPGTSIEVQTRFSKSDWTNYTQTGDYSFNTSSTSYKDWTNVTAYISGNLQWGIEP